MRAITYKIRKFFQRCLENCRPNFKADRQILVRQRGSTQVTARSLFSLRKSKIVKASMFWFPLPSWFAKRLNFSIKGRLICYSLEFLTLCRKSACLGLQTLHAFVPQYPLWIPDMLTDNKYWRQHFTGNCCVRT